MKVFNKLLPVAAIFSLAACVGGNNTGTPEYVPGGGGASATSFGSSISGQFVDAPVNGLNYWINGDSDKIQRTSGKGNFTCKVGDFVTFALGNLPLGTGPCGTIVTPDLIQPDDSNAADTIMVLLQNLGGGGSSSLLDVTYLAGQPVATAIPNINSDAGEARVNALLTMASKPTVTLATAQTAARTAHEQYMQSINTIPDSWVGKVFYSKIIRANLVSGSNWCDPAIQFHMEVFAYKDENGVKRGGFEIYGAEDVEAENAISKGEIFSKNIFTSFTDEDADSDEVYQITGSATLTEAGVMSGSWVETTLETDVGDEQYIGTKCAYKFGPIQPTISGYCEDDCR